MYLAASTNGSYWPIVGRATISGRLPILAAGYIFVDLPGHGDINDSRNIIGQEYLRCNRSSSRGFLVVRSARAMTDPEVDQFVKDNLKEQVLDGRTSMAIAITGSDTSIHENDITLNEKESAEMNALNADMMTISRNGRSGNNMHLLQELGRRKRQLLISARNRQNADGIHAKYDALCQQMMKDPAKRIPLRVFCVASNDYLAMQPDSLEMPEVFRNPEETGIPAILAYLLHDREASGLRIYERGVQKLSSIIEDISSQLFGDYGLLSRDVKQAARLCIVKTEQKIGRIVASCFAELASKMNGWKAQFNAAVDQGERAALQVLTDCFASSSINKFQSFKVTMKHHGVHPHRPININYTLTRSLIHPFDCAWAGIFNTDIPHLLTELGKDIAREAIAAENQIVELVRQQSHDPYQELASARKSLDLRGYVSEVVDSAYTTKNRTQREERHRLSELLQTRLKEDYAAAARITGEGALERMKAALLRAVEDSGASLFGAIKDYFSQTVDACIGRMRKQFDEAVLEIPTRLRLTLIDKVDLTEEHRDMRTVMLNTTGEIGPRLRRIEAELNERRLQLNIKREKC
ncbi:hypothetical protein HMN09_00905000 [Mycena chlorophos]|uniref:Uncharacterized protein n=1 Tax=Mycena chlorophos TaxID=658473 RepID=A0A8H6W2L9_MYCCL|nr:hypothetical protein HMN09_00905000 [Mycena chlorophos]